MNTSYNENAGLSILDETRRIARERAEQARLLVESLSTSQGDESFVVVSSLWNGRGLFRGPCGGIYCGPFPKGKPEAVLMCFALGRIDMAQAHGMLHKGETLEAVSLREWWRRELQNAESILDALSQAAEKVPA